LRASTQARNHPAKKSRHGGKKHGARTPLYPHRETAVRVAFFDKKLRHTTRMTPSTLRHEGDAHFVPLDRHSTKRDRRGRGLTCNRRTANINRKCTLISREKAAGPYVYAYVRPRRFVPKLASTTHALRAGY